MNEEEVLGHVACHPLSIHLIISIRSHRQPTAPTADLPGPRARVPSYGPTSFLSSLSASPPLPPARSLAGPHLSSSPFLLVALRPPFNDRNDPQFNNNVHDRIRSPIHPQAIPFHLASHIFSSSCSTYSRPHLYRLPNQRCHHRRSRPGRRCKEQNTSKLSSRGACCHRWRISTSFLGRACKHPNDQCSPWNHGRRTHRVDAQVSGTSTFPLSQPVDEYTLPA